MFKEFEQLGTPKSSQNTQRVAALALRASLKEIRSLWAHDLHHVPCIGVANGQVRLLPEE